MSLLIERLVKELADDDMIAISKMKKADILSLTSSLLRDNYREMNDCSLIETYEKQFNTNLARV